MDMTADQLNDAADMQAGAWIAPNPHAFRPAAYDGKATARRDVVIDRIPRGRVTLFAAEGGVGKSTLCLQLCEAIAWGDSRAFGGDVDSDCMGRPVVALFSEDDRNTINARLKWIRSDRAKPEGFSAGLELSCYLAGPDIEASMALVEYDAYAQSVRPTEAYAWLDDQLAKLAVLGNAAALVVVDTASVLLPVDANRPELVQPAMNLLVKLAARRDCAIIVTHHMNKTAEGRRGVRGTTAWVDAVRALYTAEIVPNDKAREMLTRARLDDGGDLVCVTLGKDNLGLSRAPLYFLRGDGGVLRDISGLISNQSPEDDLLQVIRELNAADTPVSRTGKVDGLKQRQASNWPASIASLSREKLVALANTLEQEGRIQTVGKGGALVAV